MPCLIAEIIHLPCPAEHGLASQMSVLLQERHAVPECIAGILPSLRQLRFVHNPVKRNGHRCTIFILQDHMFSVATCVEREFPFAIKQCGRKIQAEPALA